MSVHATDQYWRVAALDSAKNLAPWLRDRGSLARIARDESALLGIAPLSC